MGDGESATTERPFQSMKAVDRTSAKLSTWAASCRGCMAERPSMAAVLCGGLVMGGRGSPVVLRGVVDCIAQIERPGIWLVL